MVEPIYVPVLPTTRATRSAYAQLDLTVRRRIAPLWTLDPRVGPGRPRGRRAFPDPDTDSAELGRWLAARVGPLVEVMGGLPGWVDAAHVECHVGAWASSLWRLTTGSTLRLVTGPERDREHQRHVVASGRSIDITYDPAGRELTRRIGETVTLEHTFDPLGRLTTQSVTGTGDRAVQHRSYTYRADGNLIGIDDRLSGSRRFDLDATGRVTAVRAANWSETYAYDAAGNQTTAHWPSSHPGADATGPRDYVGTRITRVGNRPLRTRRPRPHHPAPEDPPVPQAGHLALRMGRGGPPHVGDDSGRHALALHVRPPGPPHGETPPGGRRPNGRRARGLHLGRHDPVRTATTSIDYPTQSP